MEECSWYDGFENYLTSFKRMKSFRKRGGDFACLKIFIKLCQLMNVNLRFVNSDIRKKFYRYSDESVVNRSNLQEGSTCRGYSHSILYTINLLFFNTFPSCWPYLFHT